MNIDFNDFETNILNYIKNNYPSYIREGLKMPTKYINDFLDFDIYKDSVMLFIELPNYNFNGLSNDSENQNAVLKIYLVNRNGKSSELKTNILKYATDFYKFFEGTSNNFGGLIDYGKIKNLSFFDAVEGNTSIKLAEIEIDMNIEI